MGAGWMRHLAGDAVYVFSAGSEPADQVNPVAVAAMAERDVDISATRPQRWTDEMIQSADIVVTMGCGDECPVFPGRRYIDWDLDDPSGMPLKDVRPIRDDLEQRVRDLIAELGVATAS